MSPILAGAWGGGWWTAHTGSSLRIARLHGYISMQGWHLTASWRRSAPGSCISTQPAEPVSQSFIRHRGGRCPAQPTPEVAGPVAQRTDVLRSGVRRRAGTGIRKSAALVPMDRHGILPTPLTQTTRGCFPSAHGRGAVHGDAENGIRSAKLHFRPQPSCDARSRTGRTGRLLG